VERRLIRYVRVLLVHVPLGDERASHGLPDAIFEAGFERRQ
jgi:hypothetical protein